MNFLVCGPGLRFSHIEVLLSRRDFPLYTEPICLTKSQYCRGRVTATHSSCRFIKLGLPQIWDLLHNVFILWKIVQNYWSVATEKDVVAWGNRWRKNRQACVHCRITANALFWSINRSHRFFLVCSPMQSELKIAFRYIWLNPVLTRIRPLKHLYGSGKPYQFHLVLPLVRRGNRNSQEAFRSMRGNHRSVNTFYLFRT